MEKRIAIVDKLRCNPIKCAHECIKFDPLNRSGKEGFKLGVGGKAEIANELCTEMHQICAKKCPFQAIQIVKVPQEASGTPVHQYGENGFRLYNLPIPVFGKVVGILGRNGIGKSTAIKILGGSLQPNLGDLKEEPKIEKLIQHFKGTVGQAYFERLKSKTMTIAYKPQHINLIPKQFTGKLIDLLRKINPNEAEVTQAIENCALLSVIDHNLSTLSGGELQRVAIAATILKKADVYIFDEPSSFLDIKQRLHIAKVIKDLTKLNAAVLVIDHDLIVMDYMADFIHIAYGQEGAYGIISQVKSVKNGINHYLEGFIREENIQFRDHSLKFFGRVEREGLHTTTLTKWEAFTKTQGSFKLTVDAGEVKRHDVIGILGENGIGKTTFAKMLAHVEMPTTGKVDIPVKISYKPQYIDTQDDRTVREALAHAEQYNAWIVKPMGIEGLFDQRLCDLSGGQLQTVMIASCLAQDAELYVLDEPSAFLDTEQRLVISKIIRDWMVTQGKTAMVIDHDLLFIDYISDKILVFNGVPAASGNARGPFNLQNGMNTFLTEVQLTFRRDKESQRPRANKTGSQMDQDQRSKNIWYYV